MFARLDEDGRDAMRRQIERRRHFGAEHVAIERRGARQIRHDDRNMVEASDHALSFSAAPGRLEATFSRSPRAGRLPAEWADARD